MNLSLDNMPLRSYDERILLICWIDARSEELKRKFRAELAFRSRCIPGWFLI